MNESNIRLIASRCIVLAMFRVGIDYIQEPYRTVVRELLRVLIGLYGDNLVSLVVYGSVARGSARRDSDLDVLVVFEDCLDRGLRGLGFLRLLRIGFSRCSMS